MYHLFNSYHFYSTYTLSFFNTQANSSNHGLDDDDDLVQLTMQCAVQAHFPNAIVSYTYINRARDHQRLISLDCFQLIQHRLSGSFINLISSSSFLIFLK